MKTFQTIEAAANLKGMAKHTYNRVMSAMAEDNTTAMLHAFAALTDGAKAVALQAGKFSNLYTRGERKGMAVEEAAKELTERAAAGVTRKLRKIDHICAVAFLAEYISRQRKADEPTTEPTGTTPANAATTTPAAKCLTMYLDNTAEIYNRYTAPAIAELANKDRNNGGRTNWGNVISALCTLDPCEPFRTLEGKICRAIDHARRLVYQLDGLTPTTADIDQAAHDYVAYIVECAQFEIANA